MRTTGDSMFPVAELYPCNSQINPSIKAKGLHRIGVIHEVGSQFTIYDSTISQ